MNKEEIDEIIKFGEEAGKELERFSNYWNKNIKEIFKIIEDEEELEKLKSYEFITKEEFSI